MASYYLPYVKGSMENVDLDEDGVKETLVLKFQNRVGSGTASVDLRVSVDGVDYTEKSSIKIADGEPKPLKPNMYVTSYYGDEIAILINHGGEVKPGKHKVTLKISVNWETYETTIEDEVK
ncbi:hypothetical protein J7L70_03415 [Candidatus Bathyarchaeota archaeon]|nr:hypothetical protein [Candidatus Bathyarchaeota archaeon]